MLSRRRFLATLASVPLGGASLLASAQSTGDVPRRIRGVNYVPSYASSPYETWSRYDPEVIRRELGWAAGLGLNTVRITLSYDACREQPTVFEDRLQDFLAAAGSFNLSLMPVLFDSWGVSRSAYLGSEPETLIEAYRRIKAHPAAYQMDEAALRRFEATATELIPQRHVPRSGDAAVLLWGKWTPCPPPEWIGQEHWSLFRPYVHRAVGVWGASPSIAAWDVMNNPLLGRSLRPRPDPEQAHRFVRLAVDEVRGAGASQPLTVSFSGGYGSIGPVIHELDALSTQAMSGTSRDAQRAILETRSLSKGREVYLTLGGGVLLPGQAVDAGELNQTSLVRQTIDAAEREGAGWMLWHLIEGEGLTPWAGLLRGDGSLKPAAEYVQRELRQLR